MNLTNTKQPTKNSWPVRKHKNQKMNSFGIGHRFSGEGIDIRQVSMLQSLNRVPPMPSGDVDVVLRLFENGSLPVFERLTSELAMTSRLPTPRARVGKSTHFANEEYEKTKQDVTSLLYIQEDEDYVRPTQHALDLTLGLLENANAELATRSAKFPRGTSSTSDRGGIYVFWEKNGRSIQLEVPPKNGGMFYIHITSQDRSFMDRDVTAKRLADALADAKLFSSQRLGTKNVPASAAPR